MKTELGDRKMRYKLNKNYIEIYEAINCESDVLDIISFCISNDSKLLLLRKGVLTEEFMNLRTGLAGIVLQKLVNYHIKATAVIDIELQGRFKELVFELNKSNNFRIFNNNRDAENWILNIKG